MYFLWKYVPQGVYLRVVVTCGTRPPAHAGFKKNDPENPWIHGAGGTFFFPRRIDSKMGLLWWFVLRESCSCSSPTPPLCVFVIWVAQAELGSRRALRLCQMPAPGAGIYKEFQRSCGKQLRFVAVPHADERVVGRVLVVCEASPPGGPVETDR